jgi:hypothetical protein
MQTSKAKCWPVTLLVAGSVLIGCTDVGDSLAPTVADGSSSGIDGTTSDDAESSADAVGEAATGSGADATLESATDDGPAEPDDSGAAGTGGPVDSGVAEAEPEDAGTRDSAPEETGAPDGGLDAGAPDSGFDAGNPDSSVVEAGTGAPDAGSVDGGAEPDAGHDAGTTGSPTPCTVAPCAASGANSVMCPNSPTSDGVCTPTEAAIVSHDIANGYLDGTGQLLPYGSATDNGSCYSCLNTKACLDDNQMDTGNECGDAPPVSGGANGPAACLTTLSCIFSTDCQGPGGIAGTTDVATQENVNLCYCGGDLAGSACSASGAVPDGLCVTQEAAGLGFAVSDNTDILLNFGAKNLPSGIANHLFQCASSNKCTLCK